MEFSKEVFTKVLSDLDYRLLLEEIIEIIKHNKILSVELLFGFAWGNEYKNWVPFHVNIDSIQEEILTAERQSDGQFGEDDLHIFCSSIRIEILFCHEKDIHLRYNDSNEVVKDILDLLRNKNLLHPNSS